MEEDNKKYYSDLPKAESIPQKGVVDDTNSDPNTEMSQSSVEAVKNLERKKMMPEAQSMIENVETEDPSNQNNTDKFSDTIIEDTKNDTGSKKDWFTRSVKYSVIGAGLIILMIIIIGLLMVFGGGDGSFKFSGQVVGTSGQPIENAIVTMDNQNTTTNAEGLFELDSVTTGTHTITITANGYNKLIEEVALTQDFLSNNNTRTFTLSPMGEGVFQGKLLAPDNDNYDFKNDRIVFNNEEYEIDRQGEFSLPEVDTGAYTIALRSENYVDFILKDQQLAPGSNNLGTIELVPAGDITGELKTFLTDEINLQADLVIEGVSKENLEVDTEGMFRYKDLVPGETYTLRASAPSFNTRDYEITIDQGENLLVDFKLVEEGLVAYISDREKDAHIYVSDFDGKNEKRITQKRYEPFGIALLNNDQYITFAAGSGNIKFFSVQVVGGEPQELTAGIPIDQRKDVYPNYYAEKFSTSYRDRTQNKNVLEVLNINGQGRVRIEETDSATFVDPRISSNGSYLAYILNDATQQNGLYRANINKGEKQLVNGGDVVAIYDISESGDRILYGEFNSTLNVTHLKYSELSSGETVTLSNTTNGLMYQFIEGSEDKIIYVEERDGRSNIYQYNIGSGRETNLTSKGGVESIAQQSGNILYYTNLGLYVMDSIQPIEGNFVTDQVMRYTGYKF